MSDRKKNWSIFGTGSRRLQIILDLIFRTCEFQKKNRVEELGPPPLGEWEISLSIFFNKELIKLHAMKEFNDFVIPTDVKTFRCVKIKVVPIYRYLESIYQDQHRIIELPDPTAKQLGIKFA